jgi:hypothetical protein
VSDESCNPNPVGRLQVYVPEGSVQSHWLEQGHRYLVGRGDSADFRIRDDSISRQHLEIDTGSNPWTVRDLSSKNGTRIEGRPLDRFTLEVSCWLSLAGIPARLELLDSQSAAARQQEEQTRRAAARQLTGRLQAIDEFDSLLRQTLSAFVELAECDTGALFLADSNGQPEIVATTDSNSFQGSTGVIDQVFELRQPVINSDVESVLALADNRSILAGGIRALVCLPLMVSGKQRGVIYADSRKPGKIFTDLDTDLLEGLAEQAAFLMALSKLRHETAMVRESLPKTPDQLQLSARLRRMIDRLLPPVENH